MNDHRPAPAPAAAICLPVPPAIATAWQALPREQRTAWAQMIVEAWLEPLLRHPRGSPTLVPYYTIRKKPAPADADKEEEA